MKTLTEKQEHTMEKYTDYLSDIKNEQAEEDLEEFKQEFFTDRQEDMKNLDSALKSTDFNQIKKIAHNWKGYSKPYGFKLLGIIGANLEKAAIDEDLALCENECSSAKAYLKIKKEIFKL